MRGDEVTIGRTFLDPGERSTGAEVRIFEPGWFTPIEVQVPTGAQFYGGAPSDPTAWRDDELPYHSLLLHEGATFTVTALSSCAGVATASATVPGLPR